MSQFIEIADIGFFTTGKSIRSSRSHSASVPAVSNAVSSASIVDFVKTVCLQDFQKNSTTDEDFNTNDASTPTPVSLVGPLTRARRHL
jgi:hypothetical protein